MSLVWKLLKQHVSVPQFVGYALANLFGMCIVLLSFQFYKDVSPVFIGEDAIMKTNYVILSKKIGTGNTISGRTNSFTNSEIEDLKAQPFATKIGKFTSAAYKANAHMGINGTEVLNTELFFESIPDDFVEVQGNTWRYTSGNQEVPIILPRTYMTMYNFGFAQSRSLPKLSDGLLGMIDLDILIQGHGHQGRFKGKVVGFSNRLSSILVPQAFMDWSNAYFAPDELAETTRLLMQSENPAEATITKYLDKHGYEVENNQLETEKTTYFLKTMVSVVMFVGLVISLLSFYILMLSIYLLVQKNSSKLQNLLLIGYSPAQVARPYQVLTIVLNVSVLLVAWCMLFFIRQYYMDIIETLFPNLDSGTMMPAILLGTVVLATLSICNFLAIRHKIMSIWKNKE
ncbi:hypothetical protein HMPREF0645_1957 [Hallella bergensis DSM 17361]|uniref:Efflux ABC transporter, permease protein n=1 Tax=Hallella bergensis DSM 17361 TaxID=585502 RepID=D1PYC2_9BACT|nr:hypothetical protein [Hallella bergensis]EFA43587.1 hypothetical protein HMPREF0645_1957 [Hallella bergensis DSM 17361]